MPCRLRGSFRLPRRVFLRIIPHWRFKAPWALSLELQVANCFRCYSVWAFGRFQAGKRWKKGEGRGRWNGGEETGTDGSYTVSTLNGFVHGSTDKHEKSTHDYGNLVVRNREWSELSIRILTPYKSGVQGGKAALLFSMPRIGGQTLCGHEESSSRRESWIPLGRTYGPRKGGGPRIET